MDVADRGSGQVVSDVYLLSTRNKALLVVGMRDGTLMQFEIPESQALNDLAQPTDGLKQLSCESVVRVGSVPVRFAPIPQAHRLGNLEQDSANQSRNGGESSTSRVLVYAESMHIAELTEFGQAKITPCTGIDCGGTLVHNVCQVATIADSMDTTSQGGSGIFRCFASISPISTDSDSALLGAINLLNIKLEAQCHVREYLVGSDPRRILCDDDSGMIIVAGVQRGRQQMDEFPQCSLDILDPSSGWGGQNMCSHADGLRLTSPVDYLMVYSVSGALWTVLRISEQAYSLLAQLERAMLDMPDLHPARPLLAAGRSVSRINNGHDIVTTPFGGRVDNVMSEGIIDATLATVFLEALTCAEQREVVESSPELMRLALELQGSNAQNKRRSGSTGVTDSVGGAVDAVRQLVSELNSTSVC
ncbi:hypothetical protein GGI07_003569 [Coemansia sp. Benny D115]|nr:hypothetical protein GGI07_003569 [Coemansia sp. Benny D115]